MGLLLFVHSCIFSFPFLTTFSPKISLQPFKIETFIFGVQADNDNF